MRVIFEIFVEKGCPAPEKVVIFPVKSERSSAGIAEFETIEQAMEVLVKCNHTPVDSPCKFQEICLKKMIFRHILKKIFVI